MRANAQLALKYLLNAQHGSGGGWRYGPGQPGDMSVTTWVFLAIRTLQVYYRHLPMYRNVRRT